MRTQRKIWIVLFLIIGTLLFPMATFSHSGRTDANGGHWDRSNGTYHYHDGTSKSGSSRSSSKREYESFTPPYTPSPDNPYRSSSTKDTASNPRTSNKVIDVIVFTFLVGLFGVMPICIIGKIKIEESIYKRKKEVLKLIDDIRSIIYEEESCKKRIYEAVSYLNSPPKMENVPFYIEVTDNGLSAKDGISGVYTEENGEKLYTPFLYYIAARGKHFHTDKDCSNADIELSVFNDIVRINKMLPCKKCAPKIDNTIIKTILDCHASYLNCRKYELSKGKYHDEIKQNQHEITALSHRKETLIQELQTKKEYIKKHKDLLEKYTDLLTHNNK